MKAIYIILTTLILTLTLTTGQAFAADATAAVDLNSAYVWRGITLNEGMVLQPSMDISKGGFAFNVWGNMDLDDYDGTLETGEFSEVDLTLSYGCEIKSVAVTVGYIEYLFPYRATSASYEGTRELFLGLGVSPIDGLDLGLTGYWDFDEVEAGYFNLSIGYSRELVEKLSASVGASAGYATENLAMANGGTDAGLFDYNFSLGLDYAVNDALSVGAKIAYTDTFDEDVLPDQDVNTWGGVSLAYGF